MPESRWQPQPLERLLLDALHVDAARLSRANVSRLTDSDWAAFFDLARRQRVRPLVQRRLNEGGFRDLVPAALGQTVDDECRQIAFRNLRFQAETAALARELGSRGIPVIVLKGMHLATAVYDSAGMREMNDIDVMVPREYLQTASDVVAARGYEPMYATHLDVSVQVSHHLPRALKPGAGIEVHWTIFKPTQAATGAIDGLWSRSDGTTIGGATVRALSTGDLLLHLCGHASHQHRFEMGLRPFVDIAAVVARHGDAIDWAAIDERAREWGWQRGVEMTLELARELVGAAVPGRAERGLSAARGLRAERGGSPTKSLWGSDPLPRVHPVPLDQARAHIFAAAHADGVMAPAMSHLVSDESVWSRLRHFRDRILLPRPMLASIYGLRLDTPRVVYAAYYVRRVFDLLGRHTSTAMKLMVAPESPARRAAERQNAIGEWLNGG